MRALFRGRWLIAVCVAVAVSGCRISRLDVIPKSTPPIVKIGLVAPFERRYRTLGYEVLYAVKWAIAQRNERGGMAGAMIELVALDDSSQLSQAAKFVVDPDVVGVIGPFTEEMVASSAVAYDARGLAVLTPAMCSAAEAALDSVFCVGGRVEDLASAILAQLPDTGYTALLTGAHSLLADALSPYAQEVVETRDWRSLDSVPGPLLYAGSVLGAAETLLQIQDAGVGARLWGGPSLARTQLAQIAQGAAAGVCYVVPAPVFADLTAESSFAAGYRSLAGTNPGPWAALAYDATVLLLDAIERAVENEGAATRDGVAAQLEQATDPSGQRFWNEGVRRQMAYAWYCYGDLESYPGHIVETPGN